MNGFSTVVFVVRAFEVLGVVFVAAYFLTRGVVLSFHSGGADIHFAVKRGVGFEKAEHIVEVVQAAKNKRYLLKG